MVLGPGSIEEIAFVAAVHREDEVVERRITGHECTGTRREFDASSPSLGACPIIGKFAAVPSRGPRTVDLDPRRQTRVVDE